METIHIAMWSGPRNISTTMMRSFENRPDTTVIDEPLYAHYLTTTGLIHPMQEEILESQHADWREVVKDLAEGSPAPIYFQKHMCHHITQDMSLDWMSGLRHFFLIRDPVRMVASYARKMETITAFALGLAQERHLYDHIATLTGRTPIVLDATDVLNDPKGMLQQLCTGLDIPFREEMLSWPAGRRESDGVWAPHWYQNVEQSTGFRPPPTALPDLTPELEKVIAETRDDYDYLYRFRLKREG